MKLQEANIFRVKTSEDVWIWLCLRTDEGIEGWGEVSDSGYDEVVAFMLNQVFEIIVGLDAYQALDKLANMRKLRYPQKKLGIIEGTVWSGMDQALWDIISRSARVPLYQLLGGHSEGTVPLYANLNRGLRGDRSPSALQQRTLDAIGNGFSVLKCTPFDEVTETSGIADLSMGIERLEAMAQVVPMHQIAVDCHERFNLQTLEHLLTRLSERSLIPYWVEDSLHQVYTSELPSLRSKYPQFVFGAGETSLNLHELLGVGSHCGIDILMPDVKHFGGVTAVKAAILSLEERGHRVTLHNPTGPIGTAFSAHLCTLRRDSVPLEFPWAVVSDRDHSTIPAEPVSSGAYVLSDLPGIGLDPNPDYMVEYGQKWTVSGWAK